MIVNSAPELFCKHSSKYLSCWGLVNDDFWVNSSMLNIINNLTACTVKFLHYSIKELNSNQVFTIDTETFLGWKHKRCESYIGQQLETLRILCRIVNSFFLVRVPLMTNRSWLNPPRQSARLNQFIFTLQTVFPL